MTVINTNVEALKARLAGSIAAKKLDTASNRLASGLRVNSGADDAAGSAVSMKMNAQLMGQKAAIKAASDALSLLNLQEVAVEQFANITHRIKELGVQMANGAFSDADRALAQLEADELVTQFQMVAANTRFNGLEIVNGTSGVTSPYSIQVGPKATDRFNLAVTPGATLSTTLPTQVDLTTQANAVTTYDNMVSVLQTMSEQRAVIGAAINRMRVSINNLSSAAAKTEVAVGRIIDADFALESANFAKQQILSQSSNQMLSIANRSKDLLAALIQ
ncbi:MAG: flagellin [Pseudomonadota bacterium]|nr:flagellin [Pseudomonadota bacterium]